MINNRYLKHISSFLVIIIFFVPGCAVISEERERERGEEAARMLREEVGIYETENYQQYISSVGNRLALYTDRPELAYEFEILDTFLVNALALPGGFVYVTRGLLKELETEAELAAILAHELGHINARHAEKRRQIRMATLLAGLAAAPATGGKSLIGGIVGQDMAARGYTRQAEYEADELAHDYLVRAGYEPRALIDSLDRLRELSGEIPDYEIEFLRTHPFLVDRKRRIAQQQFSTTYQQDENFIVNRSRYQRYRRQYLFREREKEFLSDMDQFLNLYQEINYEGLEKFLHDDFEFEYETYAGKEALEKWYKRKSEGVERIEYNYRLLQLDVSDTEATVSYAFEEKKWSAAAEDYPRVNSGRQGMTWRKGADRWKLMKLR